MKFLLYLCRERNIVEQVNKIAPKFQDGVKAFSDSPIIGEVLFHSLELILVGKNS